MSFEGNLLWPIGIGGALIVALWVLIRGAMHIEREDTRRGRRDLDDDHLPFH